MNQKQKRNYTMKKQFRPQSNVLLALSCGILLLVVHVTLCSCFSAEMTQSSAKRTIWNEILNMDALSLSRAIETKQVSCEQVMQVTLDWIDEINPQCHAIILLRDRQTLLDEARAADQGPRQGWLHGIPMAIKDISNVKGIPTTMGGSRLSKNFVPTFSDYFVDQMIRAGAIIIGKTNSPENGLGSHTYNERWGTTLNPFDLTKSAGGSSGGAGVAVSSRMLCLADGTDMMGSLRNPAGWNCIYSHRPTAGLIRGALASKKNPLPYPTSTAGPMARTPMDCAMLLETMAGGKEVFDSSTVLSAQLELGTLRIGWLGDWGGSLPFENGVLELCREALSRFEKKGAVVDDMISTEVFPLDDLWTSWNRIRFATVAAIFSQSFNMDILLGNNSPIKEELQWEISQGLQVSDADLAEAGKVGESYAKRLEKLFEDYDILALPSAQLFPFPQEWKWPKEISGKEMDTYHRWMQVCVPVTLGGLPCSTVPAGFGENGLPIGVQLFSRRGDDAKTLQVAQAYHNIIDWPSKITPSGAPTSILAVTDDGSKQASMV